MVCFTTYNFRAFHPQHIMQGLALCVFLVGIKRRDSNLRISLIMILSLVCGGVVGKRFKWRAVRKFSDWLQEKASKGKRKTI